MTDKELELLGESEKVCTKKTNMPKSTALLDTKKQSARQFNLKYEAYRSDKDIKHHGLR